MNEISPIIPAPMPNCVLIYSDGACSGNPGPGGYAAVLRRFEDGTEVEKRIITGRSKAHSTNIRMEMEAAIQGLLEAREFDGLPILLRTDSQLVVKGWNEWLPGWVTRGWKTAQKKPVANQELWQKLCLAAGDGDLRIEWVAGHAGEPGNMEADRLAGAAIHQGKTKMVVTQ